ncbi:hypothetical protein [Roseateles sp. YR242]|uniref:hypothetical protein n=1 Tax=Roseateles sp. YR242 TaxID=1855305 RepID=UPI000B81DE72|nr:hypothetical protein [Roseateles sp. YR242]
MQQNDSGIEDREPLVDPWLGGFGWRHGLIGAALVGLLAVLGYGQHPPEKLARAEAPPPPASAPPR